MAVTLLDELLAIPQEEIAEWPEKEQRWYLAMVEREIALSSPARFAERHSSGNWIAYPHHEYTSNAIVSMIDNDDCDLLLVDQPVRHGKSQLCSKWTPAWFVARQRVRQKPGAVLLGSYEATFAEKWGRETRAIIRDVAEEYDLRIKRDADAAARWELEGQMLGGMNTAGANGPITGKGGHLLILDDPIKNAEEARSAVQRQHLKEWWDTTWITRREGSGTKFILIMSRWHVDDLMGWLLSREDEMGMRIKRLRMPALAEDDDILGRRPGDALCPALYDREDLLSIKKDSPIAWPALYQQRPVAAGGGMFKRDNFMRYERTTVGSDDYFKLGERLVPRAECLIFATMDTAYTNSKRSDYTALAVWAVSAADPSDLILLHMFRRRATHADHEPMVMEAWRDYKPRWIGLEKISATLSLFAQCQRQGVVMRWLKPDRNKVARAETAVALTEQHRVWLPETADMADFIEECTQFPQGKHDDMVDTFAYAAAEVYTRAARGKHHRRHIEESHEDKIWRQVQAQNKPNGRHPVLGRW